VSSVARVSACTPNSRLQPTPRRNLLQRKRATIRVRHCAAEAQTVSRLRHAMPPRHMLLLVVLTGCVHASVPPVNLHEALRLELVAPPAVADAGSTIEVTYTLRNASDVPLRLCSAGGVSMVLKSEVPPYIWPMILHGITTDVECSGPISLSPNQIVTFREHGAIRRDLPPSEPVVSGKFSVWCAQGLSCTETTLETVFTLRVQRPGG
jgi:hypothetical protein